MTDETKTADMDEREREAHEAHCAYAEAQGMQAVEWASGAPWAGEWLAVRDRLFELWSVKQPAHATASDEEAAEITETMMLQLLDAYYRKPKESWGVAGKRVLETASRLLGVDALRAENSGLQNESEVHRREMVEICHEVVELRAESANLADERDEVRAENARLKEDLESERSRNRVTVESVLDDLRPGWRDKQWPVTAKDEPESATKVQPTTQPTPEPSRPNGVVETPEIRGVRMESMAGLFAWAGHQGRPLCLYRDAIAAATSDAVNNVARATEALTRERDYYRELHRVAVEQLTEERAKLTEVQSWCDSAHQQRDEMQKKLAEVEAKAKRRADLLRTAAAVLVCGPTCSAIGVELATDKETT